MYDKQNTISIKLDFLILIFTILLAHIYTSALAQNMTGDMDGNMTADNMTAGNMTGIGGTPTG